jgi:serine/threonine-protein kinase
MPRLALALALALLLAALPASAQGWRTYVNGRFGTTAQVPADWRPGREPDNGDGLAFTAPDGEASITVSGGLHVLDTVGEAMDIIEEPNEGETVTYRSRNRRAVTVSGTKGQRIFFRRSILSCRDTVWNTVQIEYPAARKVAFDPLVAHVARSLRPGKGWQAKGCG